MPDMTAGDDATQIHTDYGTINYGTNMTVTDVLEIGKSAARTVMLESWPIAERLIDQRIEIILDRIIKQMQERGEYLFERFKDPRFLAPLVTVQRSYAETGDDELGGILSGLLVDLAAEPIRSRREIVLRESVDCAPKLTTNHLNALSVILRLTRLTFNRVLDVSQLLTLMDHEYAPYYDAIPQDSFEYSYMGATPAGTYVPAIGGSIYDTVYYAHRNAMYDPFDHTELLQVASGSIEEIESQLNEIIQLIEVPYQLSVVGPASTHKLKLKYEHVNSVLSNDTKIINALPSTHQKLREFLRSRSIDKKQFKAKMHDDTPELAQFLDVLDTTSALHFNMSPVGIMLARHEIATRSPETAAKVDTLFEG